MMKRKVNTMAHILIVDQDQAGSNRLHQMMLKKGYEASIAPNLQEAMRFSREQDIDVVLMDSILLREQNGTSLHQLQTAPSAPEVIIMSENGSAEEAEIAINHGAWDYVVTSSSPYAVIASLSKLINYRVKKQQQQTPLKQVEIKASGIIGHSAGLQACLTTLLQAAQSDANMLITGETGTGKELFAAALHENSQRHKKNFVVVDCASLPETLVESTLFGHERGAFTGATQKQCGLIKQADGGTLFLDEVGELPLSVQKSFLRVLEERCFRPVGGKDEVHSNFRLVAATNQNLEDMVKQGAFREDLLFRLRTFDLQLPSLRSRLEDIPALVKYFISRRQQQNDPMFNKKISSDFLAVLRKYRWPGNVRELFHAVEHSLAAAQEHTSLYPNHLPPYIRVDIATSSFPQSLPRAPRENGNPSTEKTENDQHEGPRVVHSINTRQNLQQVREEVLNKAEKLYLLELLSATGGNIARAIKVSGLSRSRFYQLLKDRGIRPAITAVAQV
jgi:two-component system NtrC family response regulator